MIAAARAGEWNVVLTPQKPVPKTWFPMLRGLDVLGLASGGGQQAPIFAAVGAKVTVLDNSERQLEQDQIVARRDGLQVDSVLGDMRDLSRFSAESFDLVFNPAGRRKSLGTASQALLKPVVVGVGMDAVAQFLVFPGLWVIPAILVGAFVMGVPYALLRGISNRASSHEAG